MESAAIPLPRKRRSPLAAVIMEDNEKLLDSFITSVLNDSPTFSDEMISKIRNELLKIEKEAKDFYSKKAEK